MKKKKLLAHRFRSFDIIEHTEHALRNVLKTNIQYLEFDTRVSADGVIYLWHDPIIKDIEGNKYVINHTKSEVLENISIAPYRKMLRFFKCIEIVNQLNKKVKILVDIKDYGYEMEHMKILKKFNFFSRSFIVSWVPQVLIKIANLNFDVPLIFSHYNLHKFGILGLCIEKLFDHSKVSFKYYKIIGKNLFGNLFEVKNPMLYGTILYNIPLNFLSLLKKSGGGICVSSSMLSNRLTRYCKENNLMLSIFTCNNYKEYLKLANIDDVDIIFSDNANEILMKVKEI